MGIKRKIAESIVDGLSNLENRSTNIDKIAHSYRELQIEIVLNHLRHLAAQPINADYHVPKTTI